jgi:Right handed beta helix region
MRQRGVTPPRTHRLFLLILAATLSYGVGATPAAQVPRRGDCDRTLTSGNVGRFVNALSRGQTGCLVGAFRQNVQITRRGVTLTSAPGRRASLCGWVTIEDSADDVTLRRLKIDGSCTRLNTIYLRAERTVIERNEITNRHRGQSCLLVGQHGQPADGVRIRRNTIHGCGSAATQDHGVYLHETTGARVENNVIYDISAFAVGFWGIVRNSTFAHNVTDGGPASARGGLIVGSDLGPVPVGNLVEDNIISYTANAGVEGWGGSGNVVRGNCFWQNRGGAFSGSGFSQSNNIVAPSSPFVNRSVHDYRLRPGSRCAGKGPRT